MNRLSEYIDQLQIKYPQVEREVIVQIIRWNTLFRTIILNKRTSLSETLQLTRDYIDNYSDQEFNQDFKFLQDENISLLPGNRLSMFGRNLFR